MRKKIIVRNKPQYTLSSSKICATTLSVSAILIGLALVFWILGHSIPINVQGSTTATHLYFEPAVNIPGTWTHDIFDYGGTYTIVYDGSYHLFFCVNYTENGLPTADYMIWLHISGEWTHANLYANGTGWMTFEYNGVWAGLDRVELRSTIDTENVDGVVQRVSEVPLFVAYSF
jgi:hypothetical protein